MSRTPELTRRGALLLAALLAACATYPGLGSDAQARLAALLPTDLLLLGEQHDAPEHHVLEAQVVQWLAARGQLAALVLEMAEQGHSTAGLPRNASESAVRAALDWRDQAWPWADYGPAVMAAVRAGVPVLGANLPRSALRETMQHSALDTRLPPEALAVQRERIRDGHCGTLPEAQIGPMARVQIARDIAMAQALVAAHRTGGTALLLAGNGHVDRRLGVPAHLPAGLRTKVLSAQAGAAPTAPETEADRAASAPALLPGDLRWPTPPVPPRDHCAALRPSAPKPAAGTNAIASPAAR